MSTRKCHGRLGLILSVPLIVCGVTGALWCIQKRWMDIVKPDKWLMKFHQGDAFFGWFSDDPYYLDDVSVPLTKTYRMQFMVVLGVLGFIHFLFGLTMLSSPFSKNVKNQRSKARWAHHVVASLLSFPLALTIVTGALYRILRLRGFEKSSIKWILYLHQGYFEILLPYWPLLICLVLLIFIATGLYMNPSLQYLSFRLRWFFRSSSSKKKK
jgi:hypothetical protein